MARESLDIVRESFDAFAAGGLDALAEYWDPEIDWRAIEGALDDVGEIHGRDAMYRYLQDWDDMFDVLTLRALELKPAPDGRIVGDLRVKARAKQSGAEVELRYAIVYTVRDGRIVHGREYATFEEALAVAGVGT